MKKVEITAKQIIYFNRIIELNEVNYKKLMNDNSSAAEYLTPEYIIDSEEIEDITVSDFHED